MCSKKRMRDFQRCMRSIQSFSDNQAQISDWDDVGLDWVEILIRPSGGHYEGATFTFKVYFERDYPKTTPRVDCLTRIYHPNIDPTCDDYNVCLNLFDEWDEKFGLEDIIQGLLFLMYNPNLEDPLSPYFESDMATEEFEKNIKESLEGGSFDFICEDLPENKDTVQFNEDDLTKSIQLILDKAATVVLAEEEEEDREEENCDNNNDLNLERPGEAPCCGESVATSSEIIMRLDSKVERPEMNDSGIDVCDKAVASEMVSRRLSRYIPRTFIPTQPDFLVSVVMTCMELAGR